MSAKKSGFSDAWFQPAACITAAATAASVVLLLTVVNTAHAAQREAPDTQSVAAPTAAENRTALACAMASNCVNSFDTSGLSPLRFEGPATQALAMLRAALDGFPEANIVKAGDLSMEVVFTTAVGFKDLVDFRIDVQAQRIDYRSRSSFGLYDFGKNRSRMAAFSSRFEKIAKR